MPSPLKGILAVALLTALGATGCVHHVHHHRTAAVLDAEHHDAKIVIIHKKPPRKRHCWRHLNHWHCRR